jgi:hypothetical protein
VALIPTRLVPTGLGGYGQRELVSLVIPGTLVLIEIWLFVYAPSGDYLKRASHQIEGASDWILAAALFVGALAAYTLGLLGRMLAWFAFERLRKTRFPSGAEVRRRFVDEHGAEPVERALAGHDALRHALAGTTHDAFFQYAKLWLRQNRPQLAVEQHEAEINFLVSIQVPLLLAVAVAWRHGAIPGVVALLVAPALMVFLGRKALGRSRDETFDVMRNFLFAQWYAEGAALPSSRKP